MRKELQEAINEFQRQLMASIAFKNTFGPVTFQENDNDTTLSFVRQLVHVSEEALTENLGGDEESPENRAVTVMRLIDKGDFEKAKVLIGTNEDLLTFVLQTYNAAGIQARKDGDFDKAVDAFKKALTVTPDDEAFSTTWPGPISGKWPGRWRSNSSGRPSRSTPLSRKGSICSATSSHTQRHSSE